VVCKLSNDEIEVACDALWFAQARGVFDAVQKRFFDRLQPIRTGDYGGEATTEADDLEIAGMVRALRYCAETVGLDEDEEALLARLSS